MRTWDATRIARAAGAEVLADSIEAHSGPVAVTVDSRTPMAGALFVGLRGERLDGGAFASDALAAGAWGVLVEPQHARRALAAREPGQGAILAHEDPLAGLQALAAAWLEQLRVRGARVVAVTGSTGKTSTKDILAALLEGRLRTAFSPANLNTEIGMPLAILAAPEGTEALVLEMAMRGRGQIAQLAEIARPEVGVIVNVGPVHLELLGSIEAVAAAKAELIAGLPPGATAVIPASEPLLAPHRRADVVTVEFGPGGDLELFEGDQDGEVVVEDRSPGLADADTDTVRMRLRPSFAQAHNLSNLLAAVAAARALGVTPDGEVNVRFSALRGERVGLPGGIVLIDDCYNANPMSMRAAIDELIRTARGRRVAVLGDMLELGDGERAFHREIGRYAGERGVEVLVTVGPLAGEMAHGFAGEVRSVADAPAAAELLGGLLRAGDTVLVKGSRGVGLERVAQTLARLATHAQAGEV